MNTRLIAFAKCQNQYQFFYSNFSVESWISRAEFQFIYEQEYYHQILMYKCVFIFHWMHHNLFTKFWKWKVSSILLSWTIKQRQYIHKMYGYNKIDWMGFSNLSIWCCANVFCTEWGKRNQSQIVCLNECKDNTSIA